MIRRFALALIAILLVPVLVSASSDGRFERTLKVTGTTDIEVSTGSGNINVRTGDSSSVRIIGYVHSSDLFGGADRVKKIESNPPIQQTGNMIRIGKIEDPDLRRNISISYDVYVPANTALKASSGSGDISVDGVNGNVTANSGSGELKLSKVTGTVRTSTGSGNVRADAISGPFHGHTGSGEISVKQSGPGDVDLSTGSGSVAADNVKGSLRIRTGSGDVRASGEPTSTWDMQTGSGNVSAQLPAKGGYDLSLSTSSGDINVAREFAVQGTVNKHNIRGKINGGGALVELRTSSGNINVR